MRRSASPGSLSRRGSRRCTRHSLSQGYKRICLENSKKGHRVPLKKAVLSLELRFFCSSDLKMLEDISLFMSGATSVFCLPCNVVHCQGVLWLLWPPVRTPSLSCPSLCCSSCSGTAAWRDRHSQASTMLRQRWRRTSTCSWISGLGRGESLTPYVVLLRVQSDKGGASASSVSWHACKSTSSAWPTLLSTRSSTSPRVVTTTPRSTPSLDC